MKLDRWRLLMSQSGRRLTVRPMESEPPGAEINSSQKQHCFTKTISNKKKLRSQLL
ncbi:hypothetical protein P8610_16530 [Fictibacillus sp. UD]